MSNETASMREIQHNRQLIMQALNKNTTNFSNYSKISESLKEGNLKLTLNPMTDEFLFQDNKNHTVCINPTKGTLNEKPINELLLKADVDNKADKEYVDDAIAKEEERAENEYSKKTHTHSISDITNLQETLNRKSDVGHTHSISEITDLNVSLENKADKEYVDEKDNEIKERVEWYNEWTSETFKVKADTGWVSGCLDLKADKTYVNDELEKKADKTHTHTIANITNLQETLNRKSDVGHTHSISEITDLNVSLEKKADKNHTHDFFATVGIENIEGTVEGADGTGGDVLYWKPPNFPQGLTSDDDITTMKEIRCRNVFIMKDENK
ncbi:hypothetical protein TVAG_146190, partial [Trichomonas vaginalis G3]